MTMSSTAVKVSQPTMNKAFIIHLGIWLLANTVFVLSQFMFISSSHRWVEMSERILLDTLFYGRLVLNLKKIPYQIQPVNLIKGEAVSNRARDYCMALVFFPSLATNTKRSIARAKYQWVKRNKCEVQREFIPLLQVLLIDGRKLMQSVQFLFHSFA